ncbi:N-acetylmuramyl-L-alanine amidase, negative regulator of AmpC, AmpD [Sulfitobacter noctilucicola]|uniref:N-acetylmuramoyl-L-alanine amidase n=1 Tax=Sulfitobacter noctilucicola TaxID=1342301 RepID=A0A7W6M9A3_9RHOB|nr:N-acetylmuramoyl-L-alanine amidase [Sulfitobacter noctilucicola]KIN64311.1 N-acetylmuramyl-L-alanine amidase, negative regulator of AmpC, AmpD [Sulfitobacter noctilucicola]MBB4174522.1 N-acetylmuramoyl-L-alanine amidase [Sulfitobacter noctilucicola]
MPDGIVDHPSPNCGPRRNGLTPSLIVIHYTAMESADAALNRLCDPAAEVSAHYLISNRGRVTQMVDENQRAWHAGAGSWRGVDDINSRSVGIELDNTGKHPFSEPQMTALEELLRSIMERWAILPSGVIGHSDMAPGRKSDPGLHFDWARLARQGLAAPVVTQAVTDCDPDSFVQAAMDAGYPAGSDFDDLLACVRLRSAPWRSGALTRDDYAFPEIPSD